MSLIGILQTFMRSIEENGGGSTGEGDNKETNTY